VLVSRRLIEKVGFLGIYRDSDTEEFVVRPLGVRSDDAAYFGTDLEDARGTARVWLQDAMEDAERAAGWDATS